MAQQAALVCKVSETPGTSSWLLCREIMARVALEKDTFAEQKEYAREQIKRDLDLRGQTLVCASFHVEDGELIMTYTSKMLAPEESLSLRALSNIHAKRKANLKNRRF